MIFKFSRCFGLQICLCVVVTLFSIDASSQIVDPNFYPKIATGTPVTPRVSTVQSDGKILFGLLRVLPDGTEDPNWTPPSADGYVNDVQVQADGKILVGGRFKFVSGVRREGLMRLNPDGTLDSGYPTLFNGFGMTVNALALQPDGKLLVAQNNIFMNMLVRLNPDGFPDPTFQTSLPQDAVDLTTISLQADGKFLLTYRAIYEGERRSRLARFNADGSADESFSIVEFIGTGAISGGSPDVDAILLLPDGKFLIGGSFSSVNGVPKNHIARINADGTLDPTYEASADGAVFTLALQSDGKTLAGGIFSAINGETRKRLARLNSDGSLDQTLISGFENSFDSVNTISALPNGGILTGGEFIKIGTSTRYRIARLNSDGSVDNSFAFIFFAGRSPAAYIVPRPDGKILIGGAFSVVNGDVRGKISLINPDGTTDLAFPDLNLSSSVRSMLVGPDNKILIGSEVFDLLKAFNSDGSVDTGFISPFTHQNCNGIFALARQADGKILVGGSFALDGTFRKNVARLNPDGSVDATFLNSLVGPNLSVVRIAVQPDGKILISGIFTEVNGQARNRIARLHSDGRVDETFQNGMTGLNTSNNSSNVDILEILPDGKVLVGGDFETVNGVARKYLARLNSDGSLDTSFLQGLAGLNERLRALVKTVSGKIFISGSFTTVNGQDRPALARLNTDGSLDTSFNIAFSPLSIVGAYGLAVESNGNLLVGIGGSTRSVNGLTRGGLFRVFNTSAARFDYDSDGRSDLSVRRPSDGIWYILRGTAGYMGMAFGEAGDSMVPADYDGDGKTDVAMFRGSNSTWYIFNSGSQSFQEFTWGVAGDIPVPADHDGDGKADLVIFRPSTGTWYTRFSNNSFSSVTFGVAGDKPVVGDFDGDGRSDIAVYRPSDGNWHILKTGFGYFAQTWGAAGDIPVPADYDGDGQTDVAIWRPSTGEWYRIRSRDGFDVTPPWGVSGDIPVPADYDGDGKADVAVFRPSNGTWYIIGTTGGQLIQNFGQDGDVPTQSSFIY